MSEREQKQKKRYFRPAMKAPDPLDSLYVDKKRKRLDPLCIRSSPKKIAAFLSSSTATQKVQSYINHSYNGSSSKEESAPPFQSIKDTILRSKDSLTKYERDTLLGFLGMHINISAEHILRATIQRYCPLSQHRYMILEEWHDSRPFLTSVELDGISFYKTEQPIFFEFKCCRSTKYSSNIFRALRKQLSFRIDAASSNFPKACGIGIVIYTGGEEGDKEDVGNFLRRLQERITSRQPRISSFTTSVATLVALGEQEDSFCQAQAENLKLVMGLRTTLISSPLSDYGGSGT